MTLPNNITHAIGQPTSYSVSINTYTFPVTVINNTTDNITITFTDTTINNPETYFQLSETGSYGTITITASSSIISFITSTNNNYTYTGFVSCYNCGSNIIVKNINFVNNYIDSTWNKYNDNNEWLPCNENLNNNKLYDQDNYDYYCDYIKWKNGNLSICRAWCYIFKKENKMENIDIINNNILNYINNNKNSKHYIIDLLLDQINILLDSRPNILILNEIISWDINSFENSTKFKIYNILEKYK